MNLLWHTWEPAMVSENTAASSGGGMWMKFLFSKLTADGHNILWPVSAKDKGIRPFSSKPVDYMKAVADCDVAVFAWRWEMPDYPERNELFTRQMEMIEAAFAIGKRVIVHDQDHMITSSQRDWLLASGAQIYEPAFAPFEGSQTLMFPYNFSFGPTKRASTSADIVYVGNNYGRTAQIAQIIEGLELKVDFYGNWLERSPLRESPEAIKWLLPNVNFKGRLPQEKIAKVLGNAKATVHFCKPSYAKNGFVTIRWAEAADAGTMAFIPSGFALPDKWAGEFGKLGLIVDSAEGVKAFFEQPSLSGKIKLAVSLQRQFATSIFSSYENWLKAMKGTK